MTSTSDQGRKADTNAFITRLQSLPRELIDMIEVAVFTTVPKQKRTIKIEIGSAQHYDLKLPDTLALLQVSRSTRSHFQASYFSSEFICSDVVGLAYWTGHLSPKHQRLVESVTVVCRNAQTLSDGEHFWRFMRTDEEERNFGGRISFVTADQLSLSSDDPMRLNLLETAAKEEKMFLDMVKSELWEEAD